MDTKHPYWLTLLLALDRLGAALLFNRPDLTISTLCWMALTIDAASRRAHVDPLDMVAWGLWKAVDPYPWQGALLRSIGAALERLSPGHCARSRASDLALLMATASLLGAFPALGNITNLQNLRRPAP